jgi:hypothetical protein
MDSATFLVLSAMLRVCSRQQRQIWRVAIAAGVAAARLFSVTATPPMGRGEALKVVDLLCSAFPPVLCLNILAKAILLRFER